VVVIGLAFPIPQALAPAYPFRIAIAIAGLYIVGLARVWILLFVILDARGLAMKAEIRTTNGNPELFVGGRRQSRMLGRLALPSEWAPEKLDQYLDAGIDVYLTNVDMECSLCWDGEDTWDYEPYEWHLERIVRRKPDIRLILYVGCSGGAPYKWNVRHEDQLTLLSNGDRLRIASFASDAWLRDSTEALRRFVRHWQDSRFAENVIGYNPIQYSNEWHTPTSRNQPPLDDYSHPMVEHFRTWLRERYGGDEEALRRAWDEPGLTFETAEIPPEARRLGIVMRAPRLGEWDRPVLDYETCLEQARERFIIAQCRAIKEASAEPTLTCLARAVGGPEMCRSLKSPWVDIHHGPYHYRDRKIVHVSGYAKGTYRARGKLHIDQIDTGTHLMPKTGGDQLGMRGIWPGPFRLNDSLWESLEMLERDVAFSMAQNGYLYWNEGGPGWMFPVITHGTTTWGRCWFDDPEIKALIARLKKLVDRAAAAGAGSATRVAVVHADNLDPYVPKDVPFSRMFGRSSPTMTEIARAGAPVDWYALEDFEGIDRAYDLYIFPNAFYVPASLREAIRGKLAAESAGAVWFYAPGYMDERGPECANISALTGLRIEVRHVRAPVQVVLDEHSDHPLLRDLEDLVSFGSRTLAGSNNSWVPLDRQTDPPPHEFEDLPATFHCADRKVTVLGEMEADRRPGLVLARRDGRPSVWIGAPQAPWQLIRNILEHAGVHVYSRTGDQLFANEGFVALYCIREGEKVIRLPKACKVLDALEDAVIAEDADEIRFTARAGETRSFLLVEPGS
jgi:hypothetical protein